MKAEVNIERYKDSFEQLFLCGGVTGELALTRLALSKEDKEARDLIVTWMQEEGLMVKIDDIGNVYGIRPGSQGTESPVVISSHIDTVHNGGRFDGIVGVLAGLEIIRVLNEYGIQARKPIIISFWTNEEGVRFQPGMMGSGVIVGNIDVETCYKTLAKDNGITFEKELENIGYKGSIENRLKKIAAYLELHIEQGPILENNNLPLGILTGVKSMVWNTISVSGAQDHAGPCPMKQRKDALLASVNIIKNIEEYVMQHEDTNTTCTFGKFDVFPNEVSTIPDKVIFTQDMRSEDNMVIENGIENIHKILKDTAEEYGVEVEIEPIARLSSVVFDKHITSTIQKVMDERDVPYIYLYSGAGHDAFKIARNYPTGMIFVRTIGGKSHCPKELADFNDIKIGIEILLETTLSIANER